MSARPLRLVQPPPRATSATAHNVDAELAIIAGVLEQPRTVLPRVIASGLAESHFFSEPLGKAWGGLLAMAALPDAQVHPVTVAQYLRDSGAREPEGGWTAFLSRHPQTFAPIDECVRMVIELGDVRAVQAEAEAIVSEARAPMQDRAAWVANAPARISARVSAGTSGVRDFNQIMGEVLHEFETDAERAPGEILGYSTGFAGVDARIGGLVERELLLLTGPEKSGKSSLCAQWCGRVALRAQRGGRRVGALIIQWEDARTKTIARLVAARGRLDLSRRRNGTWTEDHQREFLNAAREISGIPLRIEDQCPPRLVSIAAKVRAVKQDLEAQGAMLGVVAIDSLQVLEHEGQNREQQLENALKGLVALKLAKDLGGISWIVVNHTNDDGQMVNARSAPRRWCNVWLDLRVMPDAEEQLDGARAAHLDVRLARDVAWGGSIPLWVWRSFNNLFADGGA